MTDPGFPAPPGGERGHADIVDCLRADRVPTAARERLGRSAAGRLPWTATLSPAELRIVRSHGIRPIASVSATCWLHLGRSWTEGHRDGWRTALARLRAEACAAGANAVLDVKMRTVAMDVADSMDFTLVGTAVRVENAAPSAEPIVATVRALEFVKLLEADIVPTGIAVGARHEWLATWNWNVAQTGRGNVEAGELSRFWDMVRREAHADLRRDAATAGNLVLAHVNFAELLEVDVNNARRYLGRHIVVATTIDATSGESLPADITMLVDAHAGGTALARPTPHHQSYGTTDREGSI